MHLQPRLPNLQTNRNAAESNGAATKATSNLREMQPRKMRAKEIRNPNPATERATRAKVTRSLDAAEATETRNSATSLRDSNRSDATTVLPAETRKTKMDKLAKTTTKKTISKPHSRKANKGLMYSIVTAVIALAFTACTNNGPFDSDFRTVKDLKWAKNQSFTFALPDSLDHPYDIELSVRHDNAYPYRNLWLITDYFKEGRIVDSDSVNVQLGDEYGNWSGSGLGKLFQMKMELKSDIQAGEYDKVVIWHDMDCDTVTHIWNIGLIYSKK